MGLDKKKGERRSIEFFSVCCGFRRPFKVLLDGNFIHAALQLKLDLVRMLRMALNVARKEKLELYVTPCALHELKTLPTDLKGAFEWAEQNARVLSCSHARGAFSPDECLQALLGGSTGADSGFHYFVATQDSALRDSLGRLKSGATLFVTANGIQLSAPTPQQRRLAGQETMVDMRPSDSERASQALSGLQKLRRDLPTSSKFRKKKPKGPNPLSVKKKRTKPEKAQKANRGKESKPDEDARTL